MFFQLFVGCFEVYDFCFELLDDGDLRLCGGKFFVCFFDDCVVVLGEFHLPLLGALQLDPQVDDGLHLLVYLLVEGLQLVLLLLDEGHVAVVQLEQLHLLRELPDLLLQLGGYLVLLVGSGRLQLRQLYALQPLRVLVYLL